jgi:multicomponent Na+:H+ antiporter subunit D
MLAGLVVLAAGCVVFGVLPGPVLHHVAAPAAASLMSGAAYAHAALGAPTTLIVPHVVFNYFKSEEWLTVAGTVAAGLWLARAYLHSPEPRVIKLLRGLHNGSANDYAAYATFGALVTIAVLLIG